MRKLINTALAILLVLTGTFAVADEGKNESGKGGRDKGYADEKERGKDAQNRAKHDRKADEKWEKRQEKLAKDDRKAYEKRKKRQDKQAKKAHKADEKQGKHAEKRQSDWRQSEDAWHKASSKRWDDDRRRQAQGADGRRDDYFRDGYSNVRVPNGHLPRPGECRIWFPDRPTGQQPPPGLCSRLESQVPAGAWLIQRPNSNQRYTVSAYDARQPGVIHDRAAFDYRGGALVLAPSPR